MIFKVMAVTLLAICAAENNILLPRRDNTQAIPSSHRFNRHDMPLTYTYGDDYSTLNPVMRNFYQHIQYAPLHGEIGQKNKNNAAEYTKVTPTLSVPATPTESFVYQQNRNYYRKDHLEPRVSKAQEVHDIAYKCYSPGHNIEVLSSVSRSPGHNAVYRTFPNPVQKSGKQLQNLNYVRPYEVFPNLDTQSTTTLPFELPRENQRPFAFSNPHFGPLNPNLNPNTSESQTSIVEKRKRQYSPYAKFHRLHLNIARVYSPGQLPPKPPAYPNTYSLNLNGRLAVKSQPYVPPLFNPLIDHNTMLYPNKANHKKYPFRMP